eukprot:gene14084-16601_t
MSIINGHTDQLASLPPPTISPTETHLIHHPQHQTIYYLGQSHSSVYHLSTNQWQSIPRPPTLPFHSAICLA